MPRLPLVYALLAAPFLPLLLRHLRSPDGGDWLWMAAFVLLTVSTLARATVRLKAPGSGRRLLGLLPILLPWTWFFIHDLHKARFAWTLLLVPAGAALGALTRRWPSVALGAVLGLTVVWAMMFPRADNGCTGVSGYYGMALFYHPIFAFLPAPWLIADDWRRRDES